MIVTVNDRAADAKAWGHTSAGPILRTVTISDQCPTCGGPRGVPERRPFYEDGFNYSVDCWNNPCGHIDLYPAVLAEASVTAS